MPDKNQAEPTEEQIRRRAYDIYEARGREDGREVDDWIIAEKELTEQSNASGEKTKAAKAG